LRVHDSGQASFMLRIMYDCSSLVYSDAGSWRVRGELCVGPADQVQTGAYGGTLDREET
jgi:hypothetical protein